MTKRNALCHNLPLEFPNIEMVCLLFQKGELNNRVICSVLSWSYCLYEFIYNIIRNETIY